MKLKGLDHFVITTANLDKCLHFYADILGMKHEIVNTQHVLRFGDQKINLHKHVGEFTPYAKNAAVGGQDFCLIADGDINEIKEALCKKGCEIIEGVVEQVGAVGKMDSIYMYDPDGNLVKITV